MDTRAANIVKGLERTKVKLGLGYLYEVLLHKTAEVVREGSQRLDEDAIIASGVKHYMEEKHGKQIRPVQAG